MACWSTSSGAWRPSTVSTGQAKLLAWRHPGFSTHVGDPIPPEDTRAIEDMASYLVRSAISLKRLVYIDGQKAVISRALKPNPRLGANFVTQARTAAAGRMEMPIS